MKVLVNIIVLIHGSIHLLGFLKAFCIFKFYTLSITVSKFYGIIWLTIFILFLLTFIFRISGKSYWWIVSVIAILLSQFMIIIYWKEASYGTLVNLLLLVATVIGFGSYKFDRMVSREREMILSGVSENSGKSIDKNSFRLLPEPVQNWLVTSGAANQGKIHTVVLKQQLKMKLKPGQSRWFPAMATQLFTTSTPAFNWSVDLEMNRFINLKGRDQFYHGKGKMLIKLFALFPVEDAEGNERLDQATLQRYLAEIVWFPSAAVSSYITWQAIDGQSARATLEYRGTKGSGIFRFDKNRNFKSFHTMRYKDVEDDAEPIEWIVTAHEFAEFEGIRVPVKLSAEWKLPGGLWKWLKIRVTNIRYDPMYNQVLGW